MKRDFCNIFYEPKKMYLISFLISFSITLSTVPLIKKYFQNSGIFDNPDKRSQHSKPIVRVGGIAIFASFIITFILNIWTGNFNYSPHHRTIFIIPY